jgi:hypothetical protein
MLCTVNKVLLFRFFISRRRNCQHEATTRNVFSEGFAGLKNTFRRLDIFNSIVLSYFYTERVPDKKNEE